MTLTTALREAAARDQHFQVVDADGTAIEHTTDRKGAMAAAGYLSRTLPFVAVWQELPGECWAEVAVFRAEAVAVAA